MFDRLGTSVSRHWLLALAFWVALAAGLHLCAPPWDQVTRDGDFEYLPADMTSVRGTRLLHEAFPEIRSRSAAVLVVARSEGKLQPADFRIADRLVQRFAPPEGSGGGTSTNHSAADNGSSGDHRSDEIGPHTAAAPGGDAAAAPSGEEGAPGAAPPGASSPGAASPGKSANHGSLAMPRHADGPVVGVWDYRSLVVGRKLLSPVGDQGQAALAVLQLGKEFMSIANMRFMQQVYDTLDELRSEADFPAGLELGVTGSAAIGADMLLAAEQSIRNTERTTILLVVLILLLVYRAPGLVVVPLATIAVSFSVGLSLLALLVRLSGQLDWLDFQVFKTTRIFIIVILFGAGTDYCLFLIARYRELLGQGLGPEQALSAALGRVGKALAASALTTIVGLGAMVFADFGKFRNGGPAIALCLVVTLAACVTMAPALLRAAGMRIFWPFARSLRGGAAQQGEQRGAPRFWLWLADVVLRYPGRILVVSFLLLAPLAGYGWRPQVTYDLLAELGPDSPSVRGTALLRQHFLAGQISPATVLAWHPHGAFDTSEGEQKIARLTRFLYELEYTDATGRRMRPILSVRSLTEPLGDPPGSFNPLTAAGRGKLAVLKHPRTMAQYRAGRTPFRGKVTRFDLILPWDPFHRESIALLDHVQRRLDALQAGELTEWPEGVPRDWHETMLANWHGARFEFCGATASVRDLQAVTREDRARIQQLVVLGVLAVLVLILRRPLVCTYLVLSVLLGYFVTIGATDLFFGWLYGATYHGLDWKVPIFLFVLLVALGADYNIYLTTRTFEEQQRHGPRKGLRTALARTGGIITSCGVIMAGTFASMGTGTLRAMQQLGFALALGVLLDTLLIRTILVPAFLALWTVPRGGPHGESGTPATESAANLQGEPDDRVAKSRVPSA